MNGQNKTIAKNTFINYSGLLINTLLGVFISRYVLLALGVSDFGLYGVVASFITMLNVISTAMHTTTRRYINVEQGKSNGNTNKVFNICMIVHIGFALFIFLLAETIGIWYINNYLNVEDGNLSDAMFVFQVSTIAAAIGIINVPYQALLESYEKFSQVVILSVVNTVLRLLFAIALLSYSGNVLRLYAIGISGLTLLSFVFYHVACYLQWPKVIKHKLYKDKNLYKEILSFNNYTAIGAFAYSGRVQGSQMIINYFFGTVVNAAFSIAYTVENYCTMIVNNLGQAAAPQITQNFSGGNLERTNFLVEAMSRYSILLTFFVVMPLSAELDFVLHVWLKNVPEGAVFLCQLTLVDAIFKSYCGGTTTLIQATGKVKWSQLITSFVSIMVLPAAILCYKLGMPKETILYLFMMSAVINRICNFYLLKYYIEFDVWGYIKRVYGSTTLILGFMTAIIIGYKFLVVQSSNLSHVIGICVMTLFTVVVCYFVGLKKDEKNLMMNIIKKYIRK